MLHNRCVLAVGDHFFIILKMKKTSCFKSRHFINIYIINRTLHDRLGIRILSSRAESISFEDKIRIPARPCNILYITWVDSKQKCTVAFTLKKHPILIKWLRNALQYYSLAIVRLLFACLGQLLGWEQRLPR